MLLNTLDAHRWLADHGDYLFRVARRQLHSDEMAEDAVQAAALALSFLALFFPGFFLTGIFFPLASMPEEVRMQAMFLRFLENGEIQPVGSETIRTLVQTIDHPDNISQDPLMFPPDTQGTLGPKGGGVHA